MENPGTENAPPSRFPASLLVMDMINAMEAPEDASLLAQALPAASRIARLICAARREDIPVIYVNDNFGQWRYDIHRIVRHCLQDDVPGRTLAELVRPRDDDYFLFKPRRSAFYGTALDALLQDMGSQSLIIAGLAGDAGIQLTAIDAHLRNFDLHVPSDCVVSRSPRRNAEALAYMRRVLRADTTPSDRIVFSRIRQDGIFTRRRQAVP